MKKMPKNAQRAYAVASYIAASLKAYETDSAELDRLHLQCTRAMKSYTAQAGYDSTMELADKLGDLWQEMGEKHSATIDEDSVPALIEGFSILIHPKEFKEFLGVPSYQDIENQNNKHYPVIMKSVNVLNSKLNELLGTKSVVLQKPKEKKKKEKKPKPKSKAQIAHEKQMKEIAERNKRVKTFLQEKIAKARKDAQCKK